MIDDRKLDFWIKTNKNVLFSGRHGVGKTTMVTAAFDRANLNWLYFSAATMDPWVDFIGVPKEQKDDEGPFLDLVRPKVFRDDQVEALFFDEFNRSHKKVRNAVMELIQFKSINGKKYKNLRIVWAAINPDDEDDTYDVEKLDPAQEDRFHARIELPYEPSLDYFMVAFGPKIGQAAVEWWGQQTKEAKDKISPRRLDYAITYFLEDGDVRDMLPSQANITALTERLFGTAIMAQLDTFETGIKDPAKKPETVKQIKEWLANANNSSNCIEVLSKQTARASEDKWKMVLPNLPEEVFASIYADDPKIRTIVTQYLTEEFSEFLSSKAPDEPDLVVTGKNFHKEQTPETVAGWDIVLTGLESQVAASNDAFGRMSVLSSINFKMPHGMTKPQVIRTLKLMNALVRRCQNATFKANYSAAVPITNTLIHLNHKMTGERYIRNYAPVLLDRINQNFPSSLYTPPTANARPPRVERSRGQIKGGVNPSTAQANGFGVDDPTASGKTLSCRSCGKAFVPKGDWQKKCWDCWRAENPNHPSVLKTNPVVHGNGDLV